MREVSGQDTSRKPSSPEVASYLIECLVYNAPDSCFGGYSWAQRVRAVLVHIWEETEGPECEKWQTAPLRADRRRLRSARRTSQIVS